MLKKHKIRILRHVNNSIDCTESGESLIIEAIKTFNDFDLLTPDGLIILNEMIKYHNGESNG